MVKVVIIVGQSFHIDISGRTSIRRDERVLIFAKKNAIVTACEVIVMQNLRRLLVLRDKL